MIALALILLAAFVLHSIATAPLGCEDADGFHAVAREDEAEVLAGMREEMVT